MWSYGRLAESLRVGISLVLFVARHDERPKKGLGGLTPAAYAQQLTAKTNTAKVTAGF